MGANASHEPLGPDGARNARPHSTGNVFSPYGRASLRKSLRRRKSKRKQKENQNNQNHQNQKDDPAGNKVEGPSEAHLRKMDKLRKSFRDSFRKKKDVPIPESSKPHLWQSDEASVRAGTCSFLVKYMGCVEVYESRGMQVCEEALKVLRNSRRRPVRGILYVSGDGLRVVDDDTKGLLVDQTIEKVSFCAPDRNHERGFSYICRDGTTRRWMCHGFIAVKETGERLSHAVGCAFASCLERKQKRDKECGVTMSFDQATSTFTRMGSFRQMSVTERLSDPQECKPIVEPVPVKKVENPHAIARPHATPQLLQRQGSFRVFNHLNQSSPFKRQLSLRLSDLPSNIERARSLSFDTSSLESDNISKDNNVNNNNIPPPVAPIPESSPVTETLKTDAVSAMCQQVTAGLSLLSSFPDDVASSNEGISNEVPADFRGGFIVSKPPGGKLVSPPSPLQNNIFGNVGSASVGGSMSKGEEWLAQINSQSGNEESEVALPRRNPPLAQLRSSSLGAYPPPALSPTSQKEPQLINFSTSLSPPMTNGNSPVGALPTGGTPVGMPSYTPPKPPSNDPFDAEWASLSPNVGHNPNNPFLQTTVTKAFQVQM